MFAINKKSVQMQNKYPLTDCKDVTSVFGDDLQKFAIIQWNDINHGINLDQRTAHLCFCEKVNKEKGFFNSLNMEFSTITHKNEQVSGKVCRDFAWGKVELQWTKYAISILIVLFNYILRYAIVWLIKWVGRRTFSG